MDIEKMAESLREAFGGAISAETKEGELRLKIGPKTAWIDANGDLVGESFDGLGGLEIGVDVESLAAAPAGTSVIA